MKLISIGRGISSRHRFGSRCPISFYACVVTDDIESRPKRGEPFPQRRPGPDHRSANSLGCGRVRRLLLVGLLIAALVAPGCASSGPSAQTTPTPKPAPSIAIPTTPSTPGVAGQRWLSISANPKAGSNDLVAAIDTAYGAGARGYFIAYRWSALEPKNGASNLQDLRNAVDYLGNKRGLTLLLGIQVINTTTKEVPADLASAPFDSAQTKARFHALIDRVKGVLNGHVTYLSIGNEVDVYLSQHQGEWAAYKAFYQDALNYAHSALPSVKVGATATFTGATGSSQAQVADLNKGSDVLALTYYPLGAGFRPRAPSTAEQDLARTVALAQGHPVVLQEVGYPTSPQLGSSDQNQAAFIASVLKGWQAAGGGSIPFLNLYQLHDPAPDRCNQLAGYYGLGGNADFKGYLCSLGLRKGDGTPKAGWQSLVEGVRSTGLV